VRVLLLRDLVYIVRQLKEKVFLLPVFLAVFPEAREQAALQTGALATLKSVTWLL
jgi:hypothetical protein